MKKNCWEVTECGRGPGGSNLTSLGVCKAATSSACDGLNEGVNGGRICWAVAGTLCGGEKQGSLAQKAITCIACGFYQRVQSEQGEQFVLLRPGQTVIRSTGAQRAYRPELPKEWK